MKMAGKTGDRRYQKRKISAKQKLWILLILTLLLLLAAIFAESICPYDPNMQNYDMALKPLILWERTGMGEICFPE